MKINDLIERLEKLDREAEVYLDDSSVGYKEVQGVLVDDAGDVLMV